MIRLVAIDPTVVPTEDQVARATFQLREFVPATRVSVTAGPPVVIEVRGHSVDELAPAILRAVEDAVGCGMTVSQEVDVGWWRRLRARRRH